MQLKHGGTVTFPSQKAQWLSFYIKRLTVLRLDHRCGGSVGIARLSVRPHFPFNRTAEQFST
jgi:hypothetical protein